MGMIEREQIELVFFDESHLTPTYVSWLNNPAVVRYSEQRHKTHTLESCRNFFNTTKDAGHFFWAIQIKKTNKHLGNLIVYYDKNNQVADLTIMLGDLSQQGKGLGKQACHLAVEWLRHNTDIRKVTAGTMAINKPMLRIMNSLDMIEEGRKKDHFLVNGKPIDMVMAALFIDR